MKLACGLMGMLVAVIGMGLATGAADDDASNVCPAEVTEWLSQCAIPLGTTDPTASLDDLEPLRPLVARSSGRKFVLQHALLAEGTHLVYTERSFLCPVVSRLPRRPMSATRARDRLRQLVPNLPPHARLPIVGQTTRN